MTARHCDEHLVTLPCPGCRADKLETDAITAANLIRQGVPAPRARQIATEARLDRLNRRP